MGSKKKLLFLQTVQQAVDELFFQFNGIHVLVFGVPGIQPPECREDGEQSDFGIDRCKISLINTIFDDLLKFTLVSISQIHKLLIGVAFQVYPFIGDQGDGVCMLYGKLYMHTDELFQFDDGGVG